ncbi:hypothetical protein T5B8_08909 [Salinisphaera sp. T5B8]|uniref:hypothetical protein n=1 Tax=Salinisphaera sp. T5B8 TaxID=1304154 RepID=UPI003342B0D0
MRERLSAIAGPCTSAQTTQLEPLIQAIRDRFGASLLAVVYYGACLRDGDPYAGLIDFYVVLDRCGPPGQSHVGAFFNRVIPPNVYYLERAASAGMLRCKYAVLGVTQLEAGAARGFQSSIWGRFAQPVALVYARSANDGQRVRAACGEAVVTLLRKALPAIGETGSAAHTFAAALALSYAGELRVERAARSADFVGANADEYARRLGRAAALLPFAATIDNDGTVVCSVPAWRRRVAAISWPLRRIAGKLLSVLRLAKACFTFTDAVDYAAFKIERHTGVAIDVTDRLRRHPLIFGWLALWRVYKQRILR